jgi:hypothetical protein
VRRLAIRVTFPKLSLPADWPVWVGRVAAAAAATLLVALVGVRLSGRLRYREARFLEATERFGAAIRAYERLDTAEAHVRAADLYARKFQRCLEARRHYEAAARLDSTGPWGARGRAGLMACPDYFPLEAGRVWIYGDTASGGRNMRLEASLREATGAAGELQSALYAGNKRIRVESARYEKRDWMIVQVGSGGEAATVLRFPFRAGQSWTAERGKDRLVYRIEDEDAKVSTKAGVFEHCLKVRELNARFPSSWKYDYYAPFVGKVKTTIGGPGFENPNTELVRFTAGA